MPELPEVETIVRSNRAKLRGRRIIAFESRWPKNVLPDLRTVQQAVRDRVIVQVRRRGKFIIFCLNDGARLLIHLRMSGRLEWADPGQPEPPHVRASWDLDDGRRLLFCDARKFGRIIYTREPRLVTGTLGCEPLDPRFTPSRLAALLRNRRRQLKPLLLDQSVIAGLGNIYTDEALFRAGLHPLTRADQLNDRQIRRLHRAIRAVLREAIRRHGTTIDWIYPGGWMQKHLRVYGRAGQPCRRCKTPIIALRVAQRGTHVCPRCQDGMPHAAIAPGRKWKQRKRN